MKTSFPKIITLFFGSFLSQVVQVGIFPILLAQTATNRGVDPTIIGFLLAVSWFSVLVIGPIVPKASEKLGQKNLNGLSSGLGLSGLFALALFQEPIVLIFSAICLGTALILRWVVCDTLVIKISADEERGRFIGLHEALMGLGIGLGPLVFVWVDLCNVVWLCIAFSTIAQIFFTFLNHEEAPEKAVNQHISRAMIMALWVGLAAALVGGFVESASIALFPLYFERYGFDLSVSAVLVSAFGLGGTLLQPPLGLLADRIGFRNAQIVCVLALISSCLLVVLGASHTLMLYGLLFVMGAAAGGLNTLAVIQAGLTLSSNSVPAAMTAIAISYTIGGIIGPIAAGNALELDFRPAMVLLFAAVSFVLLVPFVRSSDPQEAE